MKANAKKILGRLVLIVGIMVSLFHFGISLSFIISAVFIFFISTRFIQDLDNKGLLSVITIAGPVITQEVSKIFFASYRYEEVINNINSLFIKNNIHYTVVKKDIDSIIVYLILTILVILCSNNDTTAIGKHPSDGDPEFRKKSFKEKNDFFCKTLSQRIERINSDLDWNDSLYVPIAAEVEMTRGEDIKRYEDMLRCLKQNRKRTSPLVVKVTKYLRLGAVGKLRFINYALNTIEEKYDEKEVYLVLGDPGAGKSVSLRKLCYDLLKEAHVTGKTPVYISLKTWTSNGKDWSENNKPNRKDLIEYIKSELYKEGDIFTDDFLNTYFEKMLEDGRWYFIFDSFDEMPCLMGNSKNDVLIGHISRLLYDFLTGPNQSGGVIASRMYNRPSDSLNQTCTLRLQRFNDAKIRSMIKKYVSIDVDTIIRDLFRDRQDLVGLCRNPFHLALLINYIKKRNYIFPKNQFDLFKDFVDERLNKSSERLKREGVTANEVLNAAIELAIIMQTSDGHGLELPISEIEDSGNYPNKKWEKNLSLLEYTKICRFGGNRKTISFVHRRFQEFFYVEGIINKKVTITENSFDGILNNTGIRDALILYCQIGDKDSIKPLINFCFDVIERYSADISSTLNKNSAKLVNALYFLTEAFCNRKDAISDKIHIIIKLRSYINKRTDYIILMGIINSMSLLDPESIQLTIIDVFSLHNRWMSGVIASNCQIVKQLNDRTESGFCSYFQNMLYGEFFRSFLNNDFSLSLSDSFKYVRKVHFLLAFYAIIYVFCLIWFLIKFVFPQAPIIFVNLIRIVRLIVDHGLNLKEIVENIALSPLFSDSILKVQDTPIPFRKSITLIEICIGIVFMLVLVICRIIRGARNTQTTSIKQPIKELFFKTMRAFKYLFKKRDNTPSISLDNYTSTLMSTVILPLYMRILLMFVLLKSNKAEFIIVFSIASILLIFDVLQISHEIGKPLKVYIRKNGYRKLKLAIKNKMQQIPHYCIWFLIGSIPVTIAGIICIIPLLVIAFLFEYKIPNYLCIRFGIELTKDNLKIVSAIAFTVFIVVSISVLIIIISSLAGYEETKIKRLNIKTIEREIFKKNVKRMIFISNKRLYLRELIRKGVRLEGEWENGERFILGDDVFDRDLSLWDSKERSLETYISTGN